MPATEAIRTVDRVAYSPIDRVIVNAAVRGRNYFDPERVTIEWAA